MALEEHSDEELVVDWRGRGGASYAAASMVPPLPEKHQQSILPSKQKKAISSSDTDMSCKMTRTSDAMAYCAVTVKYESSLKVSGGGGDRISAPEFYVLSDSEGTPIASRLPGRSSAVRRVARAKYLTQTINSEVLVLDSDSDEEVYPNAPFKSSVNVEKLRQATIQGGWQEKGIEALQKKGKEVVENLEEHMAEKFDKFEKLDRQRSILEEYPSLENKRTVGSISSGTDIQVALKAATAFVADLPLRWDDDSEKDGLSTRLSSLFAKPNGIKELNVGTCDDYLLTTHAADKLPDCSTEVPKLSSPPVEAMRDCLLGTGPVFGIEEEKKVKSPVQPAFHDLTGDDDGCNSDSEWSRRDDEPASPRDNLMIGGSVPHSGRGGERPEQFLPNLGGNGGVSDHSAGKTRPVRNLPGFESHENEEEKRRSSPIQPAILDLTSDDDGVSSDQSWMRGYYPVPTGGSLNRDHSAVRRRPSLQIPGLESPDNHETAIIPSVKDLEGDEDIAKRKRSRVRKAPVSEDERAARQAQKQRERDLKKARQDEEKRAREEMKEESKRQKEESKRRKEAEKVDAAERKRLEKENDRWQKGKFALQNTTVYVDNIVIETNQLGFLLIQQLASRKYTYKAAKNPISGTIVWTMKRPSADSQIDAERLGSQADDVINSQSQLEEVEMKYVVVVYQGEDFAKLVAENKHGADLSKIRKQYPTYSVCYLINGLKKYLQKEEQYHFKNGKSWTRPNVEKVLAEFITHHHGVNSRLCIDESEIVDHIVGLTRSLAECPFKQKLTSISVRANGDHVSKGDPNKDIIKKSVWLKFLVAIEGVNGATAIAIAKEYPTMRALLNAYFDRNRREIEKVKLLEGLEKDNSESRKIGSIISKRIYRVLMANDGDLTTKEAEGADQFSLNDDQGRL